MTIPTDRPAPNGWLIAAAVTGMAPGRALMHVGLQRLKTCLAYGRLTLVLPDGSGETIQGAEAGPSATLVLKKWRGLRRLVAGGTLGFADAYLNGDWETPDLRALIDLAARNHANVAAHLTGSRVVRGLNRLRHLKRANTRSGSRKNIAYHYDLGNDFYAAWLDPTMTYSSGLFTRGGMSLEDAQEAKFAAIARRLDLKPGMRVLEIGCGWGALAAYLAREHGCQVTGLTLSKEQLSHARTQIARDGLSGRVDLRLQDYRDVAGQFDRVVSIEMFEAVGEENWPAYFQAVRDRLTPEGHALLQVITIDGSRFDAYRRGSDYIQRYIFPGGFLPSPAAFRQAARAEGLETAGEIFFGASYAETIKHWNERFQAAWPQLARGDFDERFKRMWDYYLAYCEAGFRAGVIDVGHFVLKKS